MNLKEIHIGHLIEQKVQESEINISRICNFFCREAQEIDAMFNSKSLDSEDLLMWCKLLKYDFFRIYSQHLILYSPPAGHNSDKESYTSSALPIFRKNLYSSEIINFLLELIEKGEKTKKQIVEEYGIPKTTLYKWIAKNKDKRSEQ